MQQTVIRVDEMYSNLKPIIQRKRETYPKALWIKHRCAKLQDGGDNVVVSGTVTIESLQRNKFRLSFRNFQIRGIKGEISKDVPSHLRLVILPNESMMPLDLIRNKGGLDVGCISDFIETKRGLQVDSFQIRISEFIDDACACRAIDAFAAVIVFYPNDDCQAAMVMASGEFESNRITVGRKPYKATSSKGAATTATFRHMTVGRKRVSFNEPLQLEMLGLYASTSNSLLKKLGKSEVGKVDFEDFKIGLEAINLYLLEHRAKSLFNACDVQDLGLLGANEVKIALMVNDAHPSSVGYIHVYDVFSSFDIDNTGGLTLRQFNECISIPELKSRHKLRDMSGVHYLFRKYGGDDRITFDSFATLWANHFVDVDNEIKHREIQYRCKNKMERIVPYLRRLGQKRSLYHAITGEKYDLSNDRQKVIQFQALKNKSRDEKRRTIKNVSRKQKRITAIAGTSRGQAHQLFLKQMESTTGHRQWQQRNTILRVEKSTKLSIEKKRQTIINARIQKEKNGQEVIGKKYSDRIDLNDRGLEEVPRHLYMERSSQMKLVDVKILSISDNLLKTLPDKSFFFHLISLRKLSLARNRLQHLPKDLGSLKSLEILLLGQNEIENLPNSVGGLHSLQILDISSNKVKLLPRSTCSLPLKVLDIHSNDILDLPHNLGDLHLLETLDVSFNNLKSLPESISSLKELAKLNASKNKLLDLPLHFDNMESLEDLDLSFNDIQELPASLSGLDRLQTFNLEGNRLPSIHEAIQGLQKIVAFSCNRNHIISLPASIGEMRSTVYLNCSSNKMESIPCELGLLHQLQYLCFQSNSLKEIPIEIGGLVSLQTLNLSCNALRALPHEFCLMKNLVWLDLSHNSLRGLPEHFGALSNLCFVMLSKNEMSNFPDSFKHLKKLSELYVASNAFRKMQRILCTHLQGIKILDFSHNIIEYLPHELMEMPRLVELNLRGNLLKSVPLDIYDFRNSDGVGLKLNISNNPLSNLPFRFVSVNPTQKAYEFPSGYSPEELYVWHQDEKRIYKPAAEEWNSRKESYLAGTLRYADFFQGVLYRQKKSYTSKEEVLILSRNDERLRQFYFHCKRMGSSNIHEQVSEDEEKRMQNEVESLIQYRDELTLRVKNADKQNRTDEFDRYFGKLDERCSEASARFSQAQKNKTRLETDERNVIIMDVRQRVRKAGEADDKRRQIVATNKKCEMKELNRISFDSNKSRKRLLPLTHTLSSSLRNK